MILMETKLQRFERLKTTLDEIQSLTDLQNFLVINECNWSVTDSEHIKEKIDSCEHKISNLLPDQFQLPENADGSVTSEVAIGLDLIRSQIENLENQCTELEKERKKIYRELRKEHNEFGGKTYSEFMKFQKIEQSVKKDMAVQKAKVMGVLIGILLACVIVILSLVVPLSLLDYNPGAVIMVNICLSPLIIRLCLGIKITPDDRVLAKVSQKIENEMKRYDSTISKHTANEARAKKISSILKKNKKLIHSLEKKNKKNKKFTRSYNQLREEKSNLFEELNQKIGEINETLNSISEVESDIKKKYESISDMIPNS